MLLTLQLLSPSAEPASASSIKTKEVIYTYQDVKMKGYIAWDEAQKGPRPGVIVVHEWWGHNDYARTRAEDLAKMGYTGFALDMYGDGKVAEHPKDAGKFSQKVISDMAVAKGRFLAAKKTLSEHSSVDGTKIAAIGYCFGGSVVLTMAREGLDLEAVASFHGGLGGLPPMAAKKIDTRVFVANGGADPFVKPEQITSFVGDMIAADTDLTFTSYANAQHSFTNPGATAVGKKFNLPLSYNAEADHESWTALEAFLETSFK